MTDDDVMLEYQNRELAVPSIAGLTMFEVYEANGSLLFVASNLDGWEREVGDYVVRRPWATAAEPTLAAVMPTRGSES